MFYSTTHYKYWIFDDADELRRRRFEANDNFIKECQRKSNSNPNTLYLSVEEEAALTNNYLMVLKDFCRKFKPVMPKCVISTAIQYFKRFYLNNSVMENHPKHIMVTCVFLATKIEEFNVKMQQFVNNIKGDRTKASEIVLNNELLLLHRLKYHLTISHPYRPVEGLLVDIKTRYPECNDPERYRKYIDTFLDKSFSTDACFLINPNQLALLSILYAAEQYNENLDNYLQILFNNQFDEIQQVKEWSIRIMDMINNIETPSKDYVKSIERKLEQCQIETSVNDPEQPRTLDDDEVENETVSYERYSQFREEQDQYDRKFIERRLEDQSSD